MSTIHEKQYVKKRIPIHAFRLGHDNIAALKKWLKAFGDSFEHWFEFIDQGPDGAALKVKTLEGTSYNTSPGDWILRGVEGEYYPCKSGIFEKTYEPYTAASESPSKGMKLVSVEKDLPEHGRLMPAKTNYKRWVISSVDNEGEWDDYPLTYQDEEIVEWLDESPESDPSNPVVDEGALAEIGKELAAWSRKYPRGSIYNLSNMVMDDELIALEERAKELYPLPKPPNT